MFWKKRESAVYKSLSDLLSARSLQEDFLGVKDVKPPTPGKIRDDAARVVNYSNSDDYRIFAQEVWARVLQGMDKMLDEGTPVDQLGYYRGQVKTALDLLRLSYQAKSMLEISNKRPS